MKSLNLWWRNYWCSVSHIGIAKGKYWAILEFKINKANDHCHISNVFFIDIDWKDMFNLKCVLSEVDAFIGVCSEQKWASSRENRLPSGFSTR